MFQKLVGEKGFPGHGADVTARSPAFRLVVGAGELVVDPGAVPRVEEDPDVVVAPVCEEPETLVVFGAWCRARLGADRLGQTG